MIFGGLAESISEKIWTPTCLRPQSTIRPAEASEKHPLTTPRVDRCHKPIESRDLQKRNPAKKALANLLKSRKNNSSIQEHNLQLEKETCRNFAPKLR